jgi:hypothetical protein
MKERNMSKGFAGTVIVLLLFIACAMLASAENLTYAYRTTAGDLITQNHTGSSSQVNVTLPNTTWNLDILNSDSRFKISLSGINASDYPVLDLLARTVDLSGQTYDGELGYTSGRYQAKYAYAFNISQIPSKQYTITFNYTNIGGVSAPLIYKCNFSFATNTTSTSECVQLSTSYANNLAYASTTGFSSFFLAEDTGAPGGGAGVTGGGGGGGGGSSGPTVHYVTPTPQGTSAKVYQGDDVIVQYKGDEHRLSVAKVGSWEVKFRSVENGLEQTIKLGEFKSLAIASFQDDIELSMYVSNRFAVVTFTSIEDKGFSFPLLPARKRTPPSAPEAESGITVITPPPPAVTPPAAQAIAAEAPAQLPVPESPIGLWSIIFAIVFVIFLVGGIALYRTRLHRLEKPPTVTRTGLESTGLPETSSTDSKPRPTLSEKEAAPEKEDVAEKEKVKKTVEASEPVDYHLSKEKRLAIEKYIFHAFSLGFDEAKVTQALQDKGWPKQVIDEVLADIRSRK